MWHVLRCILCLQLMLLFFERDLPLLYNLTRRNGYHTVVSILIQNSTKFRKAGRHRDPIPWSWNLHFGLQIPNDECTGLWIVYPNFTDPIDTADPTTYYALHYKHKKTWIMDPLYLHQGFSGCNADRVLLYIRVERLDIPVWLQGMLNWFENNLAGYLPPPLNLIKTQTDTYNTLLKK